MRTLFAGFNVVNVFMHDLRGYSKGPCFVEFDDVAATTSVLKTPKRLFGESTIWGKIRKPNSVK